jgi:hypothetical protein
MSFFRSYSVRIALAGLGLILHPGTVNSQTGTWTVPASGYVLDSVSQSIRPVQGFVGAAVLGSSVFGEIDWASLAPNQKSALAERNGFLIWIPDLAAPERWQTLDRLPEVQQAFWAADASRAALLTKGDQLIWLTNFNSAPVPLSTWNLVRSGRPGLPREQVAWTILAADSAADKVLLAARTGQTWNLWLASASEPPVKIRFSGHPVAAAFSPKDGGVFVADAVSHRIVQIQNAGTTPILTDLISSELLLKDPAAMVLSADGNRLFVADHTDKMIRVISSGAGGTGPAALLAELPTDTAPDSLTILAPDRYILNADDTGSQPLFLLTTGPVSGVSFVPRGQ